MVEERNFIWTFRSIFSYILFDILKFRKVAIVVAGLFLSSCIWSQEPICKIIGTESGLPSHTIYKIDQDSKGIIWLATERGICSYDGYHFRTYNSDLYEDYNMLYMRIDTSDRVWHFNLSGKLYYIDQGKVYDVNANLNEGHSIVGLELIDDLIILIIKHEGIRKFLTYKLIDKQLKLIEDNNNLYKVKDLYFARNDSSLYLVERYYKSTSISNVHFGGNINYEIDQSLEEAFFLTDNKLIGKVGSTLVLLNNGEIVEDIVVDANFYHAEVYDSVCWLLSDKGMQSVIVENNRMKLGSKILTDYKILSILKDFEGNFWLGTRHFGLLFIPNMTTEIYNSQNSELSSDHVRTLTMVDGQKLFVGLSNGDIAIHLNSGLEMMDQDFGNDINKIAVENNLLYVVSNKYFTTYNFNTQKLKKYPGAYKDLCLGLNNNVLLATSEHTSEIKKSDLLFSLTKTENSIVNYNRTYAVEVDENNRFWIGTIKGLVIYEDGNEIIDTILEYNISDIDIVNDSIAYVGTFANGIFKIKNLQVDSTFNKKITLSSNSISDIKFKDDSLYVSTSDGLNIINTLNYKNTYLNTGYGLPTKEINASIPEGNFIWVATGKGLCRIPKPKPLFKHDNYKIYFNRILINQRDTTIRNTYSLKRNERQVEVQFSTPQYSAVDITDFYFRVAAIDTTWQLAYNNKVVFSKLPFGKNEFEVYALNRNTLLRSKIEKIIFNIETPILQLLWFRVFLITLIFISSLLLLAKYISNKHAREKELLVNQRLVDGYKLTALQNHMNPHFISNSLFTIQHLLDTNERWQAMSFTSMFADIVRHTMHMTTKERISLSEEIEFLRKYVDLEKNRFQNPPKTEFFFEKRIQTHKDAILIPPLLIQPIIENVFKHANIGEKKKGILNISFGFKEDRITCEVLDNGIGMEEMTENIVGINSSSTGLKTVQERLILNGKQLGNQANTSKLFIIERIIKDDELMTKITLNIFYPEIICD